MVQKTLFATFISAILLSACGGAATLAEPSQLPPIIATASPDTPVSSEPTATGLVSSEPPPAQAVESPFAPRSGDEELKRGPAFIDSNELLQLESFPVQIVLSLKGSLPSPCHELRVKVSGPDSQNQIQLDVYSLIDPYTVCAAVLQPFEASIPLGSFPSGKHTVWVNGAMIGEFN